MEKVLIWGTGKISRQLVLKGRIDLRYEIAAFVDNNVTQKSFFGCPVISPDEIHMMSFESIFIATYYYKEIIEQIQNFFPELTEHTYTLQELYKKMIMDKYEKTEEKEIEEVLSYIKKHDLRMFPYEFGDDYREKSVEIKLDSECNLYYVEHNKKKLYFAEYFENEKRVRDYYFSVATEQDIRSPHCYQTESIHVSNGDIVVDAGAAEGLFALDCIDKASKVYIIEADIRWIEALKKTFEPYRDKVIILNVFLTSVDSGRMRTLDSIVKEKIDFLKMDIEGFEWDVLNGAKRIMKVSEKIKCSICTYHRVFDGELIKASLEKYGIKCEYSYGYVWFNPIEGDYWDAVPDTLSRCLVRGFKVGK